MAATGTPTPNIGLRIPQGTDPASVDDINYNSNLLDTKLGAVGSTSVQDQIDSLNSKFQIISSGSMHSIKQKGIYWLTSAVTDKPTSAAGMYIISEYSTEYLAGIYAVSDGDCYQVSFVSNSWTYNKMARMVSTPITATTTSSGAIEVPSTYRTYTFVGGHLTTGDPGFVVRRDSSYFTVFNNDGTPKANTAVAFTALFIY